MGKVVLFLLICMFISCSNSSDLYEIKGIIANGQLENEVIYLVSLNEPTKVDSMYVKNEAFSFNGKITTSDIKVIRTRIALRLYVQELLIVPEPGCINVILDSISSASGTKQNNLLQHWKKEDTYKRIWNFQTGIQGRKKTEQEIIKQNIQAIQAEFRDYNFDFIKNN
ncbi:MAG: DUF4369 domain-containing protein [Tannerellaceae bacterium]|nr:DUF4369 domain-containing protein [Tannerellaceae bacterium]